MGPFRCTSHGVRAVAFLLLVPLLVGCSALVLSSCGTREIRYNYVGQGSDAGSDAEGDASRGACDIGSSCVPLPEGNPTGPMLLHTGPHLVPLGSDAGGPPPCPYGGDYGFKGGWDLIASKDCVPCTCGPSSGSCELPTSMTVHDVLCQNLGQPHNDIPFNAPPGWKGGCDTMGPIGPDAGAQSISIEPVMVKKEACPVGPPEPARKLEDPFWTTDAVTCHVKGWWECNGDPDSRCVPDERPAGFQICVSFPGKVPCNTYPWTDQQLFYAAFNDTRSCSDCACGAPVGSDCASMISVYTDNACQVGQSSNLVTSAPNFCVNVPPGASLASKSATPPTYLPGTCAVSGGVPADGGTVEGVLLTTFCCIP